MQEIHPEWAARSRPTSATARALVASCVLVATPAWAADEAEVLESDWGLEERIAAVNQGGLRLLPPDRAVGVHRHVNRIPIDRASLRRGWVSLAQCHERLDPVPASQVVFHPERVRGLRSVDFASLIHPTFLRRHP